MTTSTTRVRIFYPADPAGVVPGGIDTFIRGLLAWAPDDLRFSLVGMSTAPDLRPLHRWTSVRFGPGQPVDFMPVVSVADAGTRGRVPLSLRFTGAVMRRQAALAQGFDVFDFHRPEPSLLFGRDPRPKNAYFHQDPADVSQRKSDMLWRYMPGLYQHLERRALAGLDQVWCVRESGVATLRARYPGPAEQVSFIPTWVDETVFHPVAEAERLALRARLAAQHGIAADTAWIISVGRLDTQKDPRLMFEAFRQLPGRLKACWVVIGDGVLRPQLERWIEAAGLRHAVHLIGLQGQLQVADWLRAADLYALSSAYEGMPMALLEALGSGLPVVTTPVGEVGRVMREGVNGCVAAAHEPAVFAAALERGLEGATRMRGAPALASIAAYRPQTVLAPAYERYRELGRLAQGRRLHPVVPVAARAVLPTADAPRAAARVRRSVLGIGVDTGSPESVMARIMEWAGARESRYVCFCNVHSVIETHDNAIHRQSLQGADLVLPDGAPVAWTLGAKGRQRQPRVDGPGTMWRLCAQAERQGLRIGLYGSTPATLQALQDRLRSAFPKLAIGFALSPPFRALSAEEDEAICRDIDAARIGLLFVGLGCPKQERWMAEHRGRVSAVMLGVGAAFDFHAGTAPRAPAWMGTVGLEWLHRLASDPRRLARRYMVTNSAFIARSTRELAAVLVGRRPPARGLPGGAVPAAGPLCLRTGSDAIRELAARIETAVLPAHGRVIQFVSGHCGAGTSSMAAAYAACCGERAPGSVLLMHLSAHDDSAARWSRLLADEGATLPETGADGVCHLRVQSEGAAADLLRQPALWTRLRERFDLVVLDVPSMGVSNAGLQLAAQCDGVVVVVEAERSPGPLVKEVVRRLRAVRGNVLGTVLNKGRFLGPALQR